MLPVVLGGGGVCVFVCSKRNLQTFSYPLFLIRNGTSLQLVLCHLV